MKAINWKKLLPHIIAVVSFIVMSALFCKPSFQGQTLYQHDIMQYDGASKDIADYVAKHGNAPLWTNNMFGGMPTYQIWMPANNVLPSYVNKVFTLGLPQPMQFFFLACILFYFLSQVAKVNPYIGILGALAFGYSTYNPVIIAAGHVTKMWCIAYMPAMLGSLMLIYRKKYLLGAGLLALFTATMIGLNHLQIAYYTIFILGFYTIACIVRWTINKEYSHMIKAIAFTAVAAVIGIITNAVTLMTTYEYAKETIRGGSLSVKDTAAAKGNGLTKDYAFQYSYKPIEAFTVMFPRINGGSNGIREIGDESAVTQALSEIPPQLAQQLEGIQESYWGGVVEGTSGPPYFGAIVCFLFIAFLFFVNGVDKWWIVALTAFTFLISWGKYFSEFNYFLFDHLPMYNKFRAPSVSIVMLELLWPFAAILGLQQIINKRNEADTWKKLKRAGIATIGVFVFIFMAYLSFSYLDDQLKNLKIQVAGQQAEEPVLKVINALVKDRRSIFLQDIFKSLVIIGIFFVLLFLYVRKKIKNELWVIVPGCILIIIDLFTIDSLYFFKTGNGSDLWTDSETVKTGPVMSNADQQIANDSNSHWGRVLNLTVSPFNDATTSYFHKSIGGYHAAKIGRYQDLIENKIAGEIGLLQTQFRNHDSTIVKGLDKPSYTALNMLNTAFIIKPPMAQGEQASLVKNPNAAGACWFVKEVRFGKNLQDEMNMLTNLDPMQIAIVSESEKDKVIQPKFDSAARIKKVDNDDNHNIITYKSSAASNQFAVFSEVYYSEGWNTFIDGKKMDYVKTNYALRGMNVPAGNHTIEFKFEPKSYTQGRTFTNVGQVIVLILLITGIVVEVRNRKKSSVSNKL